MLAASGNKTPLGAISLEMLLIDAYHKTRLLSLLCGGVTVPLSQHERLIKKPLLYMHVQIRGILISKVGFDHPVLKQLKYYINWPWFVK